MNASTANEISVSGNDNNCLHRTYTALLYLASSLLFRLSYLLFVVYHYLSVLLVLHTWCNYNDFKDNSGDDSFYCDSIDVVVVVEDDNSSDAM